MTPLLALLALATTAVASTCPDELKRYQQHALFALGLTLLATTAVALHPVAPLWLRVVLLLALFLLLTQASALLLTLVLTPLLVGLHGGAPLLTGALLLVLVIIASVVVAMHDRPAGPMSALKSAVLTWWLPLLAAGLLQLL